MLCALELSDSMDTVSVLQSWTMMIQYSNADDEESISDMVSQSSCEGPCLASVFVYNVKFTYCLSLKHITFTMS